MAAMSKQAPSAESLGWAWVDREIWTDCMLAALATVSKYNFATAGLFSIIKAWQVASQSRRGNYRLESRVRENRTHGSEGGEVKLPDPYRLHKFKFQRRTDS